jgi:hypothetical protein
MNYLRYAGMFVGVAVGVALLVMGLNHWADAGLGSSAQLLAPAMIAAVIEGREFARVETRKPSSAEAWRFALNATALAVMLNLLLSYAATRLMPEFAKLTIAPFASQQFVMLLALYALGYLLSNRFFVSLGAGNHLARHGPRDGA